MITIEALEGLRETFQIIKARDQRTLRRPYLRLVAAARPKLRRPVREFMAAQRKALLGALSGLQRVERIGAHKPRKLAEELFPWDEISAEGREILKPTLLEVLAIAGKDIVGHRIRKQEAGPEPRRFDPIGMKAVEWAEEHAAELVTLITAETMAAIAEVIARGIDQGLSGYHIARELRPLVGLTAPHAAAVGNRLTHLIEAGYTDEQAFAAAERYARRLHNYRTEMIARTEAAEATSEGTLQGYDQWGIEELDWIADPECCDDCDAAAARSPYKIEDTHGLQPAHPHCLIGDSLILPAGKISACMKRPYEGDVIIIKTSSGHNLTCTPNHPILTDRGFLPANEINIGNSVICHESSKGKGFINWKNEYKPIRIEDIFDSFNKSNFRFAVKMPVSSSDFHGDGKGGEVDIIRPNSLLMNSFNSSLEKHLLKLYFYIRKIRREFLNSLSMFQFFLKADLGSTNCIMGRLNLPFSLIRSHVFPAKKPRLGISSYMDSFIKKPLSDSMPGDIKKDRKGLFSFSINISLADFCRGKVKPEIRGKSTVISKDIQCFSGHVYNLETTESYYISNGIASHNCECCWVPA